MTYLPAKVKVSWLKPIDTQGVEKIEIYRYRKHLHRCDDYLEYGTKIHETDRVDDGYYIDEVKNPSDWAYAAFSVNEISISPCIVTIHTVYPDKDQDGIEDNVDPFLNDTDNDGVENKCDSDYYRNIFKNDNDDDGIIDDCDTDDDNDGILDEEDPFPWQKNRKLKIIIGEAVFEREYPDGARVGIIASPNLTDGEQFLGWMGEVEDSQELITYVTMHKDQEVAATFGQSLHTLTMSQEHENGDSSMEFGTIQGEGEKVFGASVGIIATPKEGYLFKEWRTETTEVLIGDPYRAGTSFTMPNQPVHIEAIFETDPCFLFDAALVWNHNTDFDNANGEMSVIAVGGQPPYVYKWYGRSSSEDRITNLAAGDYSVEVTDANGCKVTKQATIQDLSVDPCSTLSVNVVRIDHNTEWDVDKYNGGILVEASGGRPPYTYQWGGGTGFDDGPFAGATGRNLGDANNDGIVDEYEKDNKGLSPGSYVVTVTDSQGCVARASAVVEQQAEDPCRDFDGIYHISSQSNTNTGPYFTDTSWLEWWRNDHDINSTATIHTFPNHNPQDPISPFSTVELIEKLISIGYINQTGIVQSINSQQLLDLINLFKSFYGHSGLLWQAYDVDLNAANVWSNTYSMWHDPWLGNRIGPSAEFSVFFGNHLIEKSEILTSSESHDFKIPAAGTRHPVYIMAGSKNLPPQLAENTVYYAESYGSGSNLFRLYNHKNSSSPIVFERKVDKFNYTNNEDLGSHEFQTAIVYQNYRTGGRTPVVGTSFMWNLTGQFGIRKHGGYADGINVSAYIVGDSINYPGKFPDRGSWFYPYNDIIESLTNYGRSHYLEESVRYWIMRPAVMTKSFNGQVKFGFNRGDTADGWLYRAQSWFIDGDGKLDFHISGFGDTSSFTKVSRGEYHNLAPGVYNFSATDDNGCSYALEDIVIN